MSEEKKGVLLVVAKTAGIKIKVQGAESNWINPSKEFEKHLLTQVDGMKKLVGKNVRITLDADGRYSSMGVSIPESVKPKESTPSPTLKPADTTPIEAFEPENISDAELDQYEQISLDQAKAEMENAAKEKVAKRKKPKPVESEVEAPETCGEEQGVHKLMAGMIDMSQKQEKLKDHHYYLKLRKTKCDVKKLGYNNLNYISWAEAWDKLKQKYPDTRFKVHENPKTMMPYFSDSSGAFVKVSVTVSGLTHTIHLPVMDNKNNTVEKHDLDTMLINKSIQRAFAKAIAMHGVGLYVYQGEDLPKEEKQ